MRPRLIAVDDVAVAEDERVAGRLQGGHGGSPWMTAATAKAISELSQLQGGHGGSPWMTGATSIANA